jgi:hypothetical protein
MNGLDEKRNHSVGRGRIWNINPYLDLAFTI